MTHRAPVPLRDASHERYGGKAAGLARLIEWGFNVPDGVALSSEGEGVTDAAALADSLPPPWAVRSSAIGEDGNHSSFAGLHVTRLGVDVPGLARAIADVRESADTAAALSYRKSRAITDSPRMGVVIQRLVAADRSFVAFGRDPVSGTDVVVIEAVKGCGEPLVAGDVNPDHARVSREGRLLSRVDGDEPSGTSDEELLAVATCVREIGRRWGAPVDVELAMAEGTLWVLQARPITAGPS